MFDKLDEIEVRFQTIETDLADPGVIADRTLYTALMREHSELSAVVEAYRRRRQMAAELEGTGELADDPDDQVREMAREEAVGLTAAKIRALRPPEPYKGKGVKYAEEHIRRKVGKAAK